jgi:hypothetical protein
MMNTSNELADYLKGEGVNVQSEVFSEELEIKSQESQFPALSTIPDDDHIVIQDWSIVIDENVTDRQGWMYKANKGDLWSRIISEESQFKMRQWDRLIVLITDLDSVQSLLRKFHSTFRGLNLSFLRRALQGYQYHLDLVLESQRYSQGIYSPYNLIEGDPPDWSCVRPFELSDDIDHLQEVNPCNVQPSLLHVVDSKLFRVRPGQAVLHDFLFSTYPSRDPAGWQYSDAFSSDLWHSDKDLPDSSCRFVRRRLWIRTLVPETDLLSCRSALHHYCKSHPRGEIISTRIQRRSHFRKRWCNGVAVLSDTKIDVFLEDNYRQHVSYPIVATEPVVLSQLNASPSPSEEERNHIFGLRCLVPSIFGANDLRCVFNTFTQKDRDLWLNALYLQLSFVNAHEYVTSSEFAVSFGPPQLRDKPYFSGRLWKKGDVMWKIRYFELRKNGGFSYYKGGRYLGDIAIHDCHVQIFNFSETTQSYPFDIIDSTGEIVIRLASFSRDSREQWVRAIRHHISSYKGSNSSSNSFCIHRMDSSDVSDSFDRSLVSFEDPSPLHGGIQLEEMPAGFAHSSSGDSPHPINSGLHILHTADMILVSYEGVSESGESYLADDSLYADNPNNNSDDTIFSLSDYMKEKFNR